MKNVDVSGMSREELEQFAVASYEESEELKQKLAWYEEQIRLMREQKFGRKGERTDENQLSLFNETELLAQPEEGEPQMTDVRPARNAKKRKQKGAKDAFVKPLPKETVVYTLSAEQKVCPTCGGELHEMKKEIRKEIEVIPASVRVKEIVRYVYACRQCEAEQTEGTIVRAEAPEPLLSGSLLSPSLAAHVICRKYENRDPLYKISADFARKGLKLSRQTLSNWMLRVSEDYGRLLYERMRKVLLGQYLIHADETPVQVLKEPGRTADQNSYMWIFSSGAEAAVPIRLYRYAPSRGRTVATEFLGTYEGYVQSDGYCAYKDLGKGIIPVGCLAHARRAYLDAWKAQPKETRRGSVAEKGLRYCNVLLRMDGQRKRKKRDTWKAYKSERMKPTMEAFFAWAEAAQAEAPEKSKLGDALRYTVNQRKPLENTLLDERLELTNNEAERTVKPFVMGRKNWLFCHTPRGADASAVLYSLVETAKANELDPLAYVEWVLEEMRGHVALTDAFLDTLLPWSEKVPPSCRPQERTPAE